MPDTPKRNAAAVRPGSTNARAESKLAVRTRGDRDESSQSSSKPRTDLRTAPESKPQGEERRTDSIGQGLSGNKTLARHDGFDRVESYGQSGDQLSSVSRFQAISASPSPPAANSMKGKFTSPAPSSKKERLPAPVPHSTEPVSSRPGYTTAEPEGSSPDRHAPGTQLVPRTTPDFKTRPSSKTSSAMNGGNSEVGANGISHQDLVRQKQGPVIEEVKLVTNYFELKTKAGLKLYHYHVNVSPEPPTARQRKRAFGLFLENAPFLSTLRHNSPVPIAAVDNRCTLITMEKIKPRPGKDVNRYQCQIPYYEEGKEKPQEPSINSHTFTIIFKKELDLQEMIESLNSGAEKPQPGPMLQALDIVMAQSSSKSVAFAETETGKRMFSTSELGKLGGGLVASQCYQTCVKSAGSRLLLNINPRAASFYQEVPLLELMSDFRKGGKVLDELHKFLKGIRVEITHLKNKKGHYKAAKISGLALSPALGANAKDVHFQLKDEKTSVAEYFQKKYHTLNFPEEPVINIGTEKKPTYIPPEQCTVIGGQVARSVLDLDQTRKFSRLALTKPDESENLITENAGRVLRNSADAQKTSKLFGLEIQPRLLEVSSRVLPAPALQYGDTELLKPNAGLWNMKDRHFHISANIDGWTYLSVQDTSKDPLSGELPSFVAKLEETMGQYNLNAPQAGIARSSLNLQGFTAEKQFAKMDAFFGACSDTKMILVVIPENRPTLYAIIKFLADVKYGIHTICAEASNVHKKPRYSYFRGIAQKFNTKAGGINRCLPDETLRNFLPDKTMIAGIQVTSPVPKNQANATLSIVGVVANINENCAQWPASVRTQENSGTIADDIGGMLAERLRCWKRKNDHLPENILIYRNGMFENLTTVLEKEGEFIHTAVKTSYSGRRLPKLTIITVNKSHKTRFYPTKGASGNPQNGTVVDQDVTSTTQDEFYLQAHAGNEKSGSLCPTKYVISRNGMNLTADRVQQLTHNLCYLSARATRAVSIVPPAFYASLVCERARCYARACAIARNGKESGSDTVASKEMCLRWTRGVHEELRDSMWYI